MMRHLKHLLGLAAVLLSINVLAWNVVPQLQDNRTRNTQQKQAEEEDKTKDGKAEDIENRNVIPIFGHSSLEILNFGRAVFLNSS